MARIVHEKLEKYENFAQAELAYLFNAIFSRTGMSG